jgi:DNA-binding response OmpR family regulator
MAGRGTPGVSRPLAAAARWPYPLMSVASPSGLTLISGGCLLRLGIELRLYADAASALVNLSDEDPAAVLVPTDAAGVDLLHFVQAVAAKSDAPIIVGSGADPESYSRAYSALDAGARTLIAAPFSADQLALTVQQVDVRYKPSSAAMAHGPLLLDRDRHSVVVGDTPRSCSPREFLLLEHLVKVAPRVVSVDEIAVIIGQPGKINVAQVRRCVQRLRHTLDAGRLGEPSLIENIHGYGYRLSIAVAAGPGCDPTAVAWGTIPSHDHGQ